MDLPERDAVIKPLSAFFKHRELLGELTRREIVGRYRGATFGLLWSLITPFLMLCIYALVFGIIMKNQWPGTSGGRAQFALILFAALIVHGFFAECLGRAPLLVLGNPNYVKRVVFPLEILPWPMIGSAAFHALANVLVLIAMQVIVGEPVFITVLLFPVLLIPLVLMMAGVAWLLASLGVYFRDVTQVTGVLATAFLFVSSAFMPLGQLEGAILQIVTANPLTFFMEAARGLALHGELPDVELWCLHLAAGILVMWLGHTWFERTRRGFADVL